jgi:hypothetical protein
MSNMFGLDRGGFRALVLSPMPRHRILLARNLAMLPVAAVGVVIVMVAGRVLLNANLLVLATGLAQAVCGYAMFAMLGNYLAILQEVTAEME